MKKIQVNAAAVIRDVRQRTGLKTLMDNHGLSYATLVKVKNILLDRGLASQEEFDYLNLTDSPEKKSISAKEFLVSFRAKPDDAYLMEKYMLTVKDLEGIYDTLIVAGLLSEYEYYSRDGKAPELEETPSSVCEASTEVTLLRNESDIGLVASERRCGATPRKTYPDESRAIAKSSSVPVNLKPTGKGPAGQTTGEADVTEACPSCGLPPHPSSPEACIYCGVVYTKARRDPKYEGVALWEVDYRDRCL
ncbi:MAG: hypothetical protein HY913_03750 [Desulfomonile tiedjei]|nr:hypothetical protein [Desulfomonile tiedjei]